MTNEIICGLNSKNCRCTPLISVIIPVYNVEDYLIDCVESVINQTYKNLEIILIDDGSNDNSGILCDKLALNDSRIRVFHKTNAGLSSARNLGLDLAKGEYINFVDSDDWIAGNFYESLMSIAINSNCDVISCRFKYMRRRNSIVAYNRPGKISTTYGDDIKEQYLKSLFERSTNDSSCCTKLYKKNSIGDLRFEDGKIHEDVIFNWKVLSHISCYINISFVGYYYYLRKNSITTNSFSNRNYDLIDNAEYIKSTISPSNSKLYMLSKQYLCNTHFSVFIKLFKSNESYKKAFFEEVDFVKKHKKLLFCSPLSNIKKWVLLLTCLVPRNILYFFKTTIMKEK